MVLCIIKQILPVEIIEIIRTKFPVTAVTTYVNVGFLFGFFGIMPYMQMARISNVLTYLSHSVTVTQLVRIQSWGKCGFNMSAIPTP